MEKTTESPPRMSALPPQPPRDGASEPPAPPRTPADIPGLGPIRVRALLKAGMGSLTALRAASLENLAAIPGMSEIKARHIQEFLAQFPADAWSAEKEAMPL